VWRKVRDWAKVDFPIPNSNFSSTEEWWLRARKKAPKDLRRDFDTVAILVHWSLWKERNGRIFQQVLSTISRVFELITEEIRAWRAAGCIVAI
jgi:hypothetical protein